MESLLSKAALTLVKVRRKARGSGKKRFLDCKVQFQENFGRAKEGLCLLGMDLKQHFLCALPWAGGSISWRMYHSLSIHLFLYPSPIALSLVSGYYK